MELVDLLDNPDYVNANTATRKAIFEQVSKKSKDYITANNETRQAIREGLGLGGVNVTEPLPAKITDFDMRDAGNLIKQSMGQANEILAETSKKTGRTPVVGPAVMAGVGELIKGAGAIGELATDSAKPITEIGQTITQGAKEVNPVSGTVGQVGSYIAPYKMASSAIANTVGRVPYIRGAVNPATVLGSTGEMIGSGALVGGLTTPGDYEERMREAQLQAMMGGGVNLALRGAPALYQGGKQIATGGREGLINKTWNENPNTAFSTMGDTVYPNTTVKPWQQMTPQQQVAGLPALEASKIPSSSLFNTTGSKIAKTFAPESPVPGEILVPYQGKTLQAFGENLGRDFATRPALTTAKQLAAPVIGGLLGGPVGLAAGLGITGATNLFKMAELASLAKLGKTAALQPGFAQELKAAQQAAKMQQSFTPPNQNVGKGFTAPGQTVPGPISPNTAINPAQMAQAQTQQAVNNMPRPAPVNPTTMNYPLTVQGPGQQLPPSVMTAPDLSRRVNIEGQSSVLPSQINTTNSQTARPQQTPQQMAIQKTQEIVQQQTPKPAPVVRTQPTVKAPVEQTTIRSSNIIDKELTALDNQMTNLRDEALSNRLTPNTPEGQAYSNQLNEMANRAKSLQTELELAKKAEKKTNKSAPKTLEEKVDVVKSQGETRRNQARGNPDVSEMKIGKDELPTGIKSLSKETTGEIYPSKDAYDKAMTFKILQEDVPRASYIEGDKLITVFPQNIPKEIIRSTGISPTATIIRDAKTGKVIKD